MSNTLRLLLRNCPSWVEAKEQRGSSAYVLASPPLEGGKPKRRFHLELRNSSAGGVAVLEREDQRKLPNFCLERHINPDGSFCVFYGSEASIADDDAAEYWWSGLASFLNNQVFAERFKIWPQGAGLSHAEAADEQISMENLADPLGWKDEIWQGIFRRSGWLAKNLPRVSTDGKLVLNARSPCPRGCTWKHKLLRKRSCKIIECYQDCNRLHKPVLRAECPHRETIERIVLHEHRRQKIEKGIIVELHSKGRQCCGTMKFCPLRDASDS